MGREVGLPLPSHSPARGHLLAAFPGLRPALGVGTTDRHETWALLKLGVETQVNQCCGTLCRVTWQGSDKSSLVLKLEKKAHLSQSRKGAGECYLDVRLEC